MTKAKPASTKPLRTAQVVPLRRAATIDMVRLTAPDNGLIEKITQAFGLEDIDGAGIQETHRASITNAAGSLEGLGEKALDIYLQRIVGSFVGAAHGAAEHYSKSVTEARDMTAKLQNDDRDHDRDGPVGFESAAQRKREYAADMARQAYALRMAAEGAVQAYKQIIGDDWKPFQRSETGPSLDRQAAAKQMAAFG